MNIRFATPADAAALGELGALSFRVKFGHLYKAQDLEPFLAKVYSVEAVSADIANPAMRIFLAVEDQEGAQGETILGFCKLAFACGWPEHARGDKVIELKQLYTHPDITGRGVGAVLMDRALAEAQGFGADEIQLSVYSENPGAQKFYARYGFAKVADTHFMVGDHCDHEFLFAKLLD